MVARSTMHGSLAKIGRQLGRLRLVAAVQVSPLDDCFRLEPDVHIWQATIVLSGLGAPPTACVLEKTRSPHHSQTLPACQGPQLRRIYS